MKVEELMNKNVVYINENEPISRAVETMIKNRYHQLPVINKKFEGMIFLKDILKVKSDMTKTSVKKIIKNTPLLEKDYDAEKGIKILLETGLRALPVIEKNKVVGILSEVDIITKYVKDEIIEEKVEKIMNEPITINENDSLKKAISIMEKRNISSLPIVNWEEKLVGCINIFSFAELLIKEREKIESLRSAKEKISFFKNPVKNFSFQPITCKKEEIIKNVKNLFEKKEEIIIEEKEKPIGIIKPRDILALLEKKEEIDIICSGIKKEEIENVFQRVLEKWKKLRVEKVIIMIERIGFREKFEGKIKIISRNWSFILHAVEYEKKALLKLLRDLADREIIKRKKKDLKLRKRFKEI
ncbi:MAG: CBS domain-containing protein [Candidatus Aenigmatarchaeota archaeon]